MAGLNDEVQTGPMPILAWALFYRQYAEITIDCAGRNHDQIVTEITDALKDRRRRKNFEN